MRTITTTYDRLKAQAQRKVTCPGCGKSRVIRRTFYQTVNPFNRNDDGTVKTYLQVQNSVRQEAADWEPGHRDLYHETCWRVAPARSGDDS